MVLLLCKMRMVRSFAFELRGFSCIVVNGVATLPGLVRLVSESSTSLPLYRSASHGKNIQTVKPARKSFIVWEDQYLGRWLHYGLETVYRETNKHVTK